MKSIDDLITEYDGRFFIDFADLTVDSYVAPEEQYVEGDIIKFVHNNVKYIGTLQNIHNHFFHKILRRLDLLGNF